MEEAVAEHLLEEALGRAREDPVGVEARLDQRVALIRGDPADALQGQHPPRGALPVDPRHAEAWIVLEVLRQLRGRGGFEAEIHLEAGPERQGLDHLDRLEAAVGGLQALDPGRDPDEEVEIARHLALDAGPQDLDRDLLAGGRGARSGPARSRPPRPGVSSKLANSSSSGRPSSRSISWRASKVSNGGRSSCSCDRSAASSWPSRSARVARLWPSLMKLGPSSCSARARRWPGRPGASCRDSRRATRSHELRQRQAARAGTARCAAPDSGRCRPDATDGARSRSMRPKGARPSATRRCRRTDCDSAPARDRRARSCRAKVAWSGKRRMLSTRY